MDTPTVNSDKIDKLEKKVDRLESFVEQLISQHNTLVRVIKSNGDDDE